MYSPKVLLTAFTSIEIYESNVIKMKEFFLKMQRVTSSWHFITTKVHLRQKRSTLFLCTRQIMRNRTTG